MMGLTHEMRVFKIYIIAFKEDLKTFRSIFPTLRETGSQFLAQSAETRAEMGL
jgi:hypothetical protein